MGIARRLSSMIIACVNGTRVSLAGGRRAGRARAV